MDSIWKDLRYAARMLLKKPAYTIIAVVTLAVGIGANSAIFSVVNAVLLRSLPYKGADRLVQFWETNPLKGWTQATVAPANLFDWQKQNTSFEDIACYMGSDKKEAGLSGFELSSGDEPQRVKALFVSGNIFSVLGVEPLLGRTFFPEETEQGHGLLVILSYDAWQRRFGGDPNVVNNTIKLNGRDRTVVGVMPPGFYFPSKEAEMWVPMGWDRTQISQVRRPHFLRAVARLKAGVSLDQARAEMNTIAARLEQDYPDTNTQMGVGVGPLKDWIVEDTRPALLIFLAAVAFVLLIACANVANLLLARAAARTKEIAIRTALGARRGRIVRQLLTESLMLSIVGGALGLLLALWCRDVLVAYSPGNIPRLDEAGLDASVILFTLGVTLATTLLFGLAPALGSSRPDLTVSLKEGGQKGTPGSSNQRMRAMLVVAEVALSLVLVVSAALMIRSFIKLQRVDPGFDPENILMMRVSLPAARYSEDSQALAFFNQAQERLRSVPGVVSVGATTTPALKGAKWTSDFTIEGRPPEDFGREVRHKEITADYFRAMGIPLISGRYFNESDDDKGAAVIIINEALARRYFPNEDPVGKRIKFAKPTDDRPWDIIVGVVGDEKQDSLSAAVRPEVYKPTTQDAQSEMSLVIRTSADPKSLVGAMREEIRALDRNLPPYDIQTMKDVLYESVARERFTTLLLAVFGVVALLLASVGIYGVISYSVTQRTHEIGVRMALGAGSRDVLGMVIGHGMKLALAGVAVGLGVAVALTRLMSKLLFDVSATDPLTFAAIALLLAAVAFLACYIPARRATRVDPMVALRYE